ncbi:MAG: conjugal transfer protein TraC [Chloroflexi bacterium]|nr:conjugal transfer protein TraC [Chloroflexota bacterium]
MRSPGAMLRKRDRGTGGSAGARRFAEGERSAADVVSPSAMEETRSHLAVDGRLSRVLALTDYPRHVSPNWLGRLIDGGEPLDLSLHLEPLDSGDAVRGLTQRLVELQSSRLLDARGGRIASAEREVAYEDAERLRDALERGDERVFSAAVYVRVHGRSASGLDRAAARVQGTLSGMMATARPALYEMMPGLLSCLPAGRDHLGRRRNLDTSSAATMIPFASSALAARRGLLYGESVGGGSLVVFDPFGPDQENANKVVFAKSGAGKSYACKVEALRALLAGVEYYVIDPEGEYGRLAGAVGGQVVRLAGGSAHRINPFDLPPPGPGPERADPDARDPLAERVLALQGLLALMLAGPGQPLGQDERGALDRALYESYRRAGITADPATHDRPAPVLRDLLQVLEDSGDPHGLAERLQRYVSGSLGRLFSERTTASLDRPFVVFDVEGLEEELRPLATYLIADHLWGRVRRDPRPRVLLIDEAWSLMRHPEGARFLAQLARRARKRWLGLTTITQDVEDFLHSPEGHTVLAQSSVQLLMRQDASTAGLVAETFGLSAAEREYLLACRRGEGLFLARGNHIALRVEASPLEHELASTGPEFLASRERSRAPAPAERAADRTEVEP